MVLVPLLYADSAGFPKWRSWLLWPFVRGFGTPLVCYGIPLDRLSRRARQVHSPDEFITVLISDEPWSETTSSTIREC